MNKYILGLGVLGVILMSGCASTEVKPSKCSGNSTYGEKCILSNVPLTGVVEHVSCSKDEKCKLLISDEVGRKFTLENMEQLKIGDTVQIHITKTKI